MPFEFYNPHKCVTTCTLPAPHGQFKVMPGEYVPTPEQEAQGIEANLLRPHVAPSFLHKTPGHIRRRLRLESEQKINSDQTPAVAPQPMVAPQLVDASPVVAGDAQKQREAAPVAPTPEVRAPAGGAAQAPSGAQDDAGEGTPALAEESVSEVEVNEIAEKIENLTPEQREEFDATLEEKGIPAAPLAPVTPAPAAVPPSAPPTPPTLISPRKQEEEGTMSTGKAVRELEEFVDRKCSSAGTKEGKQLR
jgi:hypothetical protein